MEDIPYKIVICGSVNAYNEQHAKDLCDDSIRGLEDTFTPMVMTGAWVP